LAIVFSSLSSKVKIRPPVEAQATWLAMGSGWLPDSHTTTEGAHRVSPSLIVTKALPALNLLTMFSTDAIKP